VTALTNYIDLNSGADYNRFRDDCMRAIVKEVLEFEETEHNSELMLSCHDGHMTKNQSSRYTFLGKDLYDELGSAYYAIGTDFYVTNCNLPGNDGRVVKEFCSDDPLAYSMKDSEIKGGYLDFAKVEEGSNLYKYVYESIPTGSLGEYYQTGMELMKANYQLKFAPSEMYDAMILYYEVTPTEIWTD
ncbi:MAG: erythromycin esterase family protein, partial [Lachnospiraceae bacterium]|nr:erythromycin esterase family protein [Lachnospiraceae bacterium]